MSSRRALAVAAHFDPDVTPYRVDDRLVGGAPESSDADPGWVGRVITGPLKGLFGVGQTLTTARASLATTVWVAITAGAMKPVGVRARDVRAIQVMAITSTAHLAANANATIAMAAVASREAADGQTIWVATAAQVDGGPLTGLTARGEDLDAARHRLAADIRKRILSGGGGPEYPAGTVANVLLETMAPKTFPVAGLTGPVTR
jgi:hypothetical protein